MDKVDSYENSQIGRVFEVPDYITKKMHEQTIARCKATFDELAAWRRRSLDSNITINRIA